jgi:hypothetical protein
MNSAANTSRSYRRNSRRRSLPAAGNNYPARSCHIRYRPAAADSWDRARWAARWTAAWLRRIAALCPASRCHDSASRPSGNWEHPSLAGSRGHP